MAVQICGIWLWRAALIVPVGANERAELLQTVIAAHGPRLPRFFAARVREASEVEYLVQKVYLRLLKVERLDAIRCLRAYVITIGSPEIS